MAKYNSELTLSTVKAQGNSARTGSGQTEADPDTSADAYSRLSPTAPPSVFVMRRLMTRWGNAESP